MSWLAANGREKSAREEGSAPVPEETEEGEELIKITLRWENSATDPLRPFACEMSFVNESAKSLRTCPDGPMSPLLTTLRLLDLETENLR